MNTQNNDSQTKSRRTLFDVTHQLMQLTLTTDLLNAVTIGQTRTGVRRIVSVTGGSFGGPSLAGTIKPGGTDWVIVRPDGTFTIDVRITLVTDTDAPIYLSYQGRFLAKPEALQRFTAGEVLDPEDYSLVVSAKFECGTPEYSWLNDVIAVGIGEQLKGGVRYTFYQVG